MSKILQILLAVLLAILLFSVAWKALIALGAISIIAVIIALPLGIVALLSFAIYKIIH